MLTSLLAILALLAPDSASLTEARRFYDAGRFTEVVAAADRASATDPSRLRLRFLAALSHEKLNDAAAARQIYAQLASDADPAWADVGRSATAAMDKHLDEALAAVDRSVATNPSLAEAHYQRGLVLMLRRQFEEASASFDKATAVDGSYAAAHYYGGLANYRAKHIDRMAKHFEAFLALAPDAPERTEVESIMRTVRGR